LQARKGGKKSGGGDKPQRENPNKDKTSNHCNNKGHIKITCWTKHPDKKPKSVKNRKSKQEGKSSVAAGAVEDIKEEIILTAVEDQNQFVYLNNKKCPKTRKVSWKKYAQAKCKQWTLPMCFISVQS
jgi:hypothetical protein